jgi:hypothetical protein
MYNLTTTSENEVEAAGLAETIGVAGEPGATIFVTDLCFFLWLFSELSLCLRFFSSTAIFLYCIYVESCVCFVSWVAKKKVFIKKNKK